MLLLQKYQLVYSILNHIGVIIFLLHNSCVGSEENQMLG